MYIPLEDQLELLLRIVAAAICGAVIGFERERRMKTAGIRTHLIVCLASALMMVVSKYGFTDVLGEYVKLDPSRVAAGVVTAIGFLGAGIIFTREQTVSGLTTSAGLWATVGVGIAIGCGLYLIGAASTILLVIIQIILHCNLKFSKKQTIEPLLVSVTDTGGSISPIVKRLEEENVEIINIKIRRKEDHGFQAELLLRPLNACAIQDIVSALEDEVCIDSIEIS